MRNQSVRLYLYSSLAIVFMALVWGMRSIPKQGELAEDTLKASVEQELIVVSGAVKAATEALRYRLLDVLKAEGNDRTTRTFQNSQFIASALLEWEDNQWKMLWNSSKSKKAFQTEDLKQWMVEWPLAKLNGEQTHFVRVPDHDSQPYMAILVPVRKPNNVPMIGVGILPMQQFGLNFAPSRTREISVFDDRGIAVALSHPAYLGTAVRREGAVEQILSGQSLSARHEWKNDQGQPMFAAASRLGQSNLYAVIESQVKPVRPWRLQAWLVLALQTAGALLLNWYLFNGLLRPLSRHIEQQEQMVEFLRKQLSEKTIAEPTPPQPEIQSLISEVELPDIDFEVPVAAEPTPASKEEPAQKIIEAKIEEEIIETPEPEEPKPEPVKVPLSKVVNAALRSLNSRMQEAGVELYQKSFDHVAVEGDILQLQTALEEILKNAIEAMVNSPQKQLSVFAERIGNRIRLRVEDTGVGIPSENLDKVFEPFFSTKDSQGVARGLGLNVVRRVMDEMKGYVTVTSQTGEGKSGTLVEMDWPLITSKADEAPAVQEEQAVIPEPPQFSLQELDIEENDEEFVIESPTPQEWQESLIRKPKVRTLS